MRWADGSGLEVAPAATGIAAALARRMPHLCLGFAALLALSWWTLAHVPLDQRPPPPPPPPAQQQQAHTDVSGVCDACSACSVSDCDCAADACSGGALSCDCVAVPPGAVTHTFEAAAERERPRCERTFGKRVWASLGLLLPLVVLFVWRRRR